MACEIEEGRIAKINDCRFAGGALHFNLQGVVTGDLEGDLSHHGARVPLMETLRNVGHDHFQTRHV